MVVINKKKHFYLVVFFFTLSFKLVFSQATFYPSDDTNQSLLLTRSQINQLDNDEGESYYFPCLAFPYALPGSITDCPYSIDSKNDTSYSDERIPILGLITNSDRVVSAVYADYKTVNGIESYYADFYVNNINSDIVPYNQKKYYINSGTPRYSVNLSLNVPQDKRPFLANVSYYKVFDDELIIGLSRYNDPEHNPGLPAFDTTQQLSIKIKSESLETHAQDMISINTLGQVNLVACHSNSFWRRCPRRTPDTYTKYLVVGYRQTATGVNVFPATLHYASRVSKLEAVLYVVNDRTQLIQSTYPSWTAENNRLSVGGRQLIEQEYTVHTEISSGQEHAHEDNSHLFSFNEDGTYKIMP